jgi:predicted RecA/RadA family phage recombinase
MAQNFIESGELLDYTVGSGETITAGQIVAKGDIIGVALGDGVEGDVVVIKTTGVFELPKATGGITLGAKVYWVAADSNVTTTASGNTLIGAAWTAQASGDTTVQVRLIG